MKRETKLPINSLKGSAMKKYLVFILIVFIGAVFISSGCKGRGKRLPRLNLLLITVDGMGGGRVGPKVAKPMEMPVFDRAWAQGTVLSRMIVTSPYRDPSYSSIFTGMYPSRHGVRDDRTDVLSDDVTTLAEILREAGWSTGAVAGNIDTLPKWGLSQGFSYYDNEVSHSQYDTELPRPQWAPAIAADVVTSNATGWLKDTVSNGVPWFLWVEYSDTLPPRKVPSPFSELFPDNSYAASLAYVDANIGILLGKLRDLGVSDRTLVVITSPQSLPLGEHDEFSIVMFPYLSTISVPAIFMLPGKIPPGKEINQPVSSTDLMPTILSLMGLTSPRGIDGIDISEAIVGAGAVKEKVVYSENMFLSRWLGWKPVFSIIADNYHFININPPELYDIERDREEKTNIFSGDKTRTDKIKAEMEAVLSRMQSKKSDKEAAIESDVENKLKRLGYLPPAGAQTGRMATLPKEEIVLLMNRVRTMGNAGPESTAQEFKKILETYPDFGMASYQLAEILRNSKSFDEAEPLYKNAIIFGPRYIRAAALVNLAKLMALKKQYVEAENLLKLAIELIPYSPEVYVELGNTYLVQKLDADAEKQFRKAIELDPASYRAHFGLASLYIADPNRIPAATEELELTLKYNPDFALAHLMIGTLATQYYKNNVEAEKHLRKVLELSPNSPAAEGAKALLQKIAAGK